MVGNVAVEPTMPATIMSVNKPITVTAALTLATMRVLIRLYLQTGQPGKAAPLLGEVLVRAEEEGRLPKAV